MNYVLSEEQCKSRYWLFRTCNFYRRKTSTVSQLLNVNFSRRVEPVGDINHVEIRTCRPLPRYRKYFMRRWGFCLFDINVNVNYKYIANIHYLKRPGNVLFHFSRYLFFIDIIATYETSTWFSLNEFKQIFNSLSFVQMLLIFTRHTHAHNLVVICLRIFTGYILSRENISQRSRRVRMRMRCVQLVGMDILHREVQPSDIIKPRDDKI